MIIILMLRNWPWHYTIENAMTVCMHLAYLTPSIVCFFPPLLRIAYYVVPGNTKGGNIPVLLTSCLTGLD